MNAPTTPEAGQKAEKLVALVSGRIVTSRASQGQRGGYLTVLRLPAPDAYTSPATIEVHSAERLGEPDAVVHGKVRIGGFGRSYKAKREDRDGRPYEVTVQTADNTLDWLA